MVRVLLPYSISKIKFVSPKHVITCVSMTILYKYIKMLNGWISDILHIITSNALGAIKWLLRDFYLTTQRKVTRQAALRRQSLVEDGVLASCMAKACHLGR